MNKSTKDLFVSLEPQLKTSLDTFKLIQPDLLSVEELVDVLHERGVDNNVLPENKDQLVSLFKRVAFPLPQREFRKNFRGSLIMKKRKKADRIVLNESSADTSKTYSIGVSGSAAINRSNIDIDSPGERLKPPLDLVNFERKKIRLNSSPSTTRRNEQSSDLDKIVIKKRKSSESTPDAEHKNTQETNTTASVVQSKDLKPQTDDRSENGSCSNQEYNGTRSKPEPKKIALKRNHLLSAKDDSTCDKPTTKSEKKRKPITWP